MISIAMPTYETFGRGCEFLRKNFAQFEKQKFKNFEVVISDHSRDNKIKDLCREYEDSFTIKYFRNEEKRGSLSHNTNNAIKNCSGSIIKILFQDDFLYDEDSLLEINDSFDDDTMWLATSCQHTYDGITIDRKHIPRYNSEIFLGKNTIGNPSVVSFRNQENPILLDEGLTWMVDVDYYMKMHERFGKPKILEATTVVITQWEKQLTNLIPPVLKEKERLMMVKRYA
jgi:glycosyltransferase involved in cell wall biosynthesis